MLAQPLPSTASLGLPPLSKRTQLPALVGLSKAELQELVASMGEPAFRAEQLHHWLYVHCERSYESMSNLSKRFRETLAAHYQVGVLQLHSVQVSQDGTRKYLFQLPDGELIETVLMYFRDRATYSLCISTQVGCAMNCSFCATGKLGFKRHLTVAEIVDQYLFAQHESGQDIRNVVFMGQGEPLHNYEATLAALRLLNQSAEVGYRRMTVSTSGVVPHIQQLAAEKLPITLAISLHAPDDHTREQIMPINKKWPLAQLMPALRHYANTTGRRLTVEYILLKELNDSVEQAHRLGQLLRGLHANVNLIPYNPIAADLPSAKDFKRSSPMAIEAFRETLSTYGRKVTVRLERGVDIDAACGQLANRHQGPKAEAPTPTSEPLLA